MVDSHSPSMDKYDIRRHIRRATKAQNVISVGVTWIDGRTLFKAEKGQSKWIYGICHFSQGVWMATPVDFEKPTMITTIRVAPVEDFCEKSYQCLNCDNCPLNKFNRAIFIAEFDEYKNAEDFAKEFPTNFIHKGFWANRGEWKGFWAKFIMGKEGGVYKLKEEK